MEAWTSQHKHFGVTVTSRIEGGHSCLKKFLGTSKSDLFGVVKVISMLHTEQFDKIREELAKSRDSTPHDINAKFNTWMDPEINLKVVPQALKLLKQQYELTLQPTFKPHECTGEFERTMGVPCGHTIHNLMALNRKISAAHFNIYWLYNRPTSLPNPVVPEQEATDPLRDVPPQIGMIDLNNIDPLLRDPADMPPPPPPAVLPPLKVRAKGRPRKNDTSTKRLPSAWERNQGPQSSGVSLTPYLMLR